MKQLNKKIKEFMNDTITMFKEFFNKKTIVKQVANMLSFIRLFLIIPILILIIIYFKRQNTTLLIITGILALIGGITDYFDGKWARKFNTVSEYGKKLDQISDKTFASILSLILLSVNNYFIITFILEILIIITNALFNIKFKNINNDSNIIGKLKQWPLFALLFMGFISKIDKSLYDITFVLFIITSIMQLLTIFSYIIKHNKEIKKYITSKIKGTTN